jgi:hypothetical protein
MGGVLVQLEQLGEEEVRGYLYPPSKCDRWGQIIRVKGGRIIWPPDNLGKIPRNIRPHYWEKTTSGLHEGGNIRVRGGRLSGPRIIRPKSPQYSAPITGIKPPRDLADLGGGGLSGQKSAPLLGANHFLFR